VTLSDSRFREGMRGEGVVLEGRWCTEQVIRTRSGISQMFSIVSKVLTILASAGQLRQIKEGFFSIPAYTFS
jgi:hypothetical protein